MSYFGTNGHPIVEPTDQVPVTYLVKLAPELARSLEAYATSFRQKPQTIIAESVRAYLGVDG